MLYYNENKMNKYNIRRMVPSKRITTSNMNNYMKKMFITFICLLAVISISAQTQQGYVKTKGRLGNNGSVIAGSRIQGATIQIKGRTAVLSQADGTFSIPIPAQKFYLQNVQKQGFVLTDPDILSRQHNYSADPLVLVMEDKAQQEAERRAIERKISRKLYAELEKRQDEIDALLEQNKISEEKYRELQQQLNKDQDDNASIIKEMAERYMKIDFDEVDDFNRQISDCIINGRLTEADSLLRTKGDISERFYKLSQHHEANVQARAELEKSEEMEKKNREDLAQDCYSWFEIYKLKHMNDSAAYYIEKRSSLDTTNIQWNIDAGEFICDYLNLSDSKKYLLRALIYVQNTFGELSMETAQSYGLLGKFYLLNGQYNDCLEQYNKALDIISSINELNNPKLSTYYNNLGILFSKMNNFVKAESYLKESLKIAQSAYGEDNLETTNCYANLGALYNNLGKYEEAVDFFNRALIYDTKHKETRAKDLAVLYNNLGFALSHLGEYKQAENNYLLALEIEHNIYGEKHYRIGTDYNNLGANYMHQKKYSEALNYYQKALETYSLTLGPNHPEVFNTYGNIADVYIELGDYEKAMKYAQLTVEKESEIYGENNVRVATSYNTIANIFNKQEKYDESSIYLEKSLSILKSVYGEEHPNVALSYYNIGVIKKKAGKISEALEYTNKALGLLSKFLPENHPTMITIKKTYEELKNCK